MVQITIGSDASIIDKGKEHGLRHGEDGLVYLFHLGREFRRACGQLAVIDARFWSLQERFGHLVAAAAMRRLHDLTDVVGAISVASSLVRDQLDDIEKALLAVASYIREE
jgi:hypothetical protein